MQQQHALLTQSTEANQPTNELSSFFLLLLFFLSHCFFPFLLHPPTHPPTHPPSYPIPSVAISFTSARAAAESPNCRLGFFTFS